MSQPDSPMSVSADRPEEQLAASRDGSTLPAADRPAEQPHTSQAVASISDPDRSETMDANRNSPCNNPITALPNTTCPCGNPIILDGLVVKAHWEGKVCQDCESEMFRKHEARLQRAFGAAADLPVEPSDYADEKRCEVEGGWFGPDCERCDGKRYTQSPVLIPCPACNPADRPVEGTPNELPVTSELVVGENSELREENAGVVAHGSLVPEENGASRLTIAAANAIAWLADHPDTDESYRKTARQVEAELRIFASKQPPAPTLSEVLQYRREMEELVEYREAEISRLKSPVENSELPELLDGYRDALALPKESDSESEFAAYGIAAARKGIEELFGSLQRTPLREGGLLEDQISARDTEIRRLEAEISRLREENAKLRPVWECPECLFAFDVQHEDDPRGGHSCPVCEIARLQQDIKYLRDLNRSGVSRTEETLGALSAEISRLISERAEIAQEFGVSTDFDLGEHARVVMASLDDFKAELSRLRAIGEVR